MRRTIHKHLRWLLIPALAGLALTATLNLVVNPWRVLPKALSCEALDPYRDIDAEIRTCKAGLAMRGPWDILILGSSRPNSGLNPESPAFNGYRAVNLGLNGGDIYESDALLDLALKSQKPSKVILFLDPGYISRPGKIQIETDFDFSPLAPGDPIERTLRYVFSQRAADASFATLRDAARSRQPAYTTRGMQRKKPQPIGNFKLLTDYYLATLAQAADYQRQGIPVQTDKLELVRHMLDACAEHGVGAVLAFPPNHLTVTQVMEERGAPDPWFLAERETILRTIRQANAAHPHQPPATLCDLNFPNPITTEPYPPADSTAHMRYWFDPVHFNPQGGDILATQLLAPKAPPTYSLHPDPNDPAAYLADVKARFQAAANLLPDHRSLIREKLASLK